MNIICKCQESFGKRGKKEYRTQKKEDGGRRTENSNIEY